MTPEGHTDFADTCRAACPGFEVAGSIRRARKSELLVGVVDGAPVVAKRLIRAHPIWDWYFAHEVAVYRAFAARPPGFPVPRVIAVADDVLVIERFDVALAHRRRPYATLAPGALDAVLALPAAIAAYAFPTPPPPPPAVARQLAQRLLEDPTDPGWIAGGLARCHARELIDDTTLEAAHAALAAHAPVAASHGDLLLRNAMTRGDGTVVPIDWECAGLHVADWDLALVWTQLAPEGRARIDARLDDHRRRQTFRALAVFALCRELVFLDSFRAPADHAGRRRVVADLDATATALVDG